MTGPSFSRREFLGLSASAAAMLGLTGCAGLKFQSSGRQGRFVASEEKARIAWVGFEGKGLSDIMACKDENIVGLCDVDWGLPNVKKVFETFPNAKKFRDFRQMLLEMDDQIDAVGVSVPDHMHFLIALMAISMGKHVFVQKPLTHTIWEARELREAARRHGVVTQMGNQGHAGEGIRLMREWIQGGVIGAVKDVHIWTDRPNGRWPTGVEAPTEKVPTPETLDWNQWIGGAPYRDYNPIYHPRKWRARWDFGTGALGDMGCHLIDAAFWALDMDQALDAGAPIGVEAETQGLAKDTFPTWSIITYEIPARGTLPPVTLKWYDSGKKPDRPKMLEVDRQLNKNGQLYYGEKGVIFDDSEYGKSPRLIPEATMQAMRDKLPAKTIPRVKGGPHKEWIEAIKGGPTPGSNFEYATRLTEFVLLGNLAILAKKKIVWDATRMQVTNCPEVNDYVRLSYRKGWEPSMLA